MGEYKKENLYSSIPGAGNVYSGGEQIWNQSKIRAYFNEIFEQLKVFNDNFDAFYKALMAFVNDDTHKGDEAVASKEFINSDYSTIAIDTLRSAQILQGMMQGPGFEGGTSLLTDFIETFEENEDAILNTSKLEKVGIDFANYNTTFKTNATGIKSDRDEAWRIISGCDVCTLKSIEDPDSTSAQNSLEEFVSEDGKSGFVPELRKNFISFLEEHNDDFSKSDFKTLVENIKNNLSRISSGLGDGAFDPDTYTDTLSNIVYEKAKALENYDEYIENYKKYIKGKVPMSQVYMYDPVNMNSGSFVNNKVDLKVGGQHVLMLTRAYDSQSDMVGAMGRGWIFNFEEHLKKYNDETITLYYGDGKVGSFKKTVLGKETVFLEIHGEPGVLKKTQAGYRLCFDDNEYIDYDEEGFIAGFGNNYGEHTTVEYTIFEKNDGEKHIKKPIPSKVKTKEGSFISFNYDENGLLVKACDHADREVLYKYEECDGKPLLFAVVAPNGSQIKYSYTDKGQIASSTRADGVIGVVCDYDKAGRIIHQTMPDGGEFSYSYDDNNHVTTAIEPNGCKVEYLSDEIGRHVGTRYPKQGIEEKYTYNDRGLKTSYTDKRGFTTRYSYDNRGHLTGVVGPEGLHEFYTYDANGKLTSRKDSEGNITKYTYDFDGNLYCVTNALGEKVRFEYEDGRVVSIRDAENKRTTLTYDEFGNVASVTDENGVTIKYECDSLGRVVATEDAEGNRTTFDLDVDDNIRRVVDPEGNMTSFDYNQSGNLSRLTNPDGTTKIWEYNALGKASKITDEDNRVTQVFYNHAAQEEKIVLPNKAEISYEYDLLGNLSKITDPDGNQTTYTHDNSGNILGINKNSVSVSAFSYDGLGRVKSETDGNGNTTSYEYDANGNITKTISPNGAETVFEYDKLGRLVKKIDAIGRISTCSYDKNGHLVLSTDPSGLITENVYKNNRLIKVIKRDENKQILLTEFEYDACGRVKSELQADGLKVSYDYTKSGRISRITGSNGRIINYRYDPNGRVIEIDDSGKITRNTYTGTGKLKSVTDALGNRTEYKYNELDLISKIERFGDGAEENHVTSYGYGLSGELLSITDALGQSDEYSYDTLGNLISHIDRDGLKTTYTRDNNGNITGVNYADGKSVKLSYNALNVLQEVKDHLGLTRIESDILGRTIAVTDYKGRKVSYEYGNLDEQTAIIYPDGKRAEYSYDSFGRLTSLYDGTSNEPVTYTYDEYGRLASKNMPNGIKTSMEYYQGGLIKSLTSFDNQGILDKYIYKYDSNCTVTDIERNRRGMDAISGKYHYEYDALGRLTKSFLNGQPKATYKYDAFGNRTEMSDGDSYTCYEYDALDRMLRSVIRNNSGSVIRNTYSYDKRGNQIAVTSDDILKKTFKYDAMGKMVYASDSENGEITYTYNAFGFRVEQKRPEEQIEYVCDLSKDYYNVLERAVNGQTESFVYDTNVVSMNRGGSNYYYLQDELGSTLYLTGTDGLTLDSYAYDDFGRRVDPYTGKLKNRLGKKDISHAYTQNGNIIQPFAFTGYQEDDVTELNFAQARYYDPSNGRFNSEDKVRGFIETPETLNHYEYCFNNPISFADLDGNTPKWLSNAFSKAKEIGSNAVKYCSEHKEEIIKTGIKVAAGVAVGAACVAAAPVVASAVAGAFAASAASTAIATVATTAAIGGAFSGTTSIINQLVDSNGKSVNFKKVGVDALSGALKGAVAGTVGVLGAGAGAVAAVCKSGAGSFLIKTGANALIDVGGDFLKAKIDNKFYGAKDALKSAATSVFASCAGKLIGTVRGKLPNAGKWLSNNTTIDMKANNETNLYNIYNDLASANARRAIFSYPVEEAEGRLEEAITSYIVNNFLNYDRGAIQKQIQNIFGAGYSDLVDKVYKKYFGTNYQYACE